MNPGLLDRRITILEPSGSEKNQLNELVPSLVEVGRFWARVETLKGREVLKLEKINSELPYKITIRYRKGIHSAMVLKYEERELEIISPPIEIGRRKYLELMCVEKKVDKNG